MLKFEADTLFYMNLNLNWQNLINVSYTHKGQFGEICVTKLRSKNSEQKNVIKLLTIFFIFGLTVAIVGLEV